MAVATPPSDPTVPRPPVATRRSGRARRPSRRVFAVGVLLVMLAAGAVLAGRRSSSSPVHTSSPNSPPTTVARAEHGARRFDVAVGATTGCQALVGAEPQLTCPLPAGTVTYTQVDDAAARYRVVVGDAHPIRHGDAACARGAADERAWSQPSAPTVIVGRYACLAAGGRAEMWWTVDDIGLVGHATRTDGDLAALFTWWRDRHEG
jgi:hypothetical protein